jgi:hypothetical protein
MSDARFLLLHRLMWIEARISPSELTAALGKLLPMTIHLDDEKTTDRSLDLGAPTEVSLVAGRGLRLACAAELRWSTTVGTIPFRLRDLRVVLVPSVEIDEHPTIAFRLEVEHSDFVNVPSLVDAGVAQLVQSALATRPLLWDLASSFTKTVPLTNRIEPTRRVAFSVRDARVEVTEAAVVLAALVNVDFSATGERRPGLDVQP